MYLVTRWAHSRTAALAAAGALALGLAGYAAPAGASAAVSSPNGVQPPGAVSPTPAPGTPELVYNTGKVLDRINQMVQCGNTMFAVGTFSEIVQGGTDFARSNIFSFQATSPYTITSWAPQVNGTINSIAFNSNVGCGDAYIGGDFTSVNGTAATDIAKISTTTGDVVTAFGHSTAGGQVETLASVGGHILVGGYFKWINGSGVNPYMTSVNPTTGLNDHFVHLNITGFYHYCSDKHHCTKGKTSSVQNQQLSHTGDYDLVEGDFTSVGGLHREQIFMLNLTTKPASVTPWTSAQWDGSDTSEPYRCIPKEAFYIRSAAWGPGDSTVYIADTGDHPLNGTQGTTLRTGLCDAVAAFPATMGSVTDNWIEYAGCDSYYSVAADTGAVYAAGHPRWADNSHGCNRAGVGAIPDQGLQGLHPTGGTVELRTNGKPVYTMSRANASNMLLTTAGLWISSSNRFGSQACGQMPDHSGICFLPYPTS
jgi:hypothetical protein